MAALSLSVPLSSTLAARNSSVQQGSCSTSAFATSSQCRLPSAPAPDASQLAIRCQGNDGNAEQGSFGRREFVSLSAAAVAGGIWGAIAAPELANAADLTQRLQRGEYLKSIKEALRSAIKANPELVPSLLKLALNDALTYDKATKTGGANGSIRFSSELSRPENKGLEGAVSLLTTVKEQLDAESPNGPLGWADLIQLGGESASKKLFLDAAIAKAGGDEKKGLTLFAAYGSNGQWGYFEKNFGRKDATEPDPEGRVPVWEEASVAEIKQKFAPYGLKPRQITVLASFLGDDPTAVEEKLATDTEFLPWIDKYRKSRQTVSRTDYEVDLISAFTNFSVLGQVINYEAYTFATPPLKLRF